MKTLQWVCRHDTVRLVRAHPKSDTGLKARGRSMWKDELNCLNLIQCVSCGKFLETEIPSERVYGEGKPSEC